MITIKGLQSKQKKTILCNFKPKINNSYKIIIAPLQSKIVFYQQVQNNGS